ncbi:hypothetical protein ACJVDH_14315 [Pedobacter sp. AW1-32]|uniref:hypothetical protein n=1 Tax=Pedobacter sp. AW1-32 TaxID=3383026 RepID=UPI003FEE4E56
MERLCLDCSKPLYGRADKKYCDDACRNNYNNRQKIEDSTVLKQINACLKKNRLILSRLVPQDKKRVSKEKLQAAGFRFDYHTHVYIAQNGNTYIFCYEYGYLQLANGEFLLVKRDDKKKERELG